MTRGLRSSILNQLPDQTQGFIELILVFTPRLSEVGPSAATATPVYTACVSPTRDASIASFGNPAVEMVVVLFMLIAGISFALHFQLLRGRPLRMFRDSEFRFYIGVVFAATAVIAADLLIRGHQDGIFSSLRLAIFQATSITTTTGFATADFDLWPNFSKALLFLLMFVGGCSGSTGGSVKVVRIMIVAKKLAIDLKRLVQPYAVLPVRVGKRAIPEEVVTSVTTFFILFLACFGLGGLLLALMGMDMVSAFSASAACLGNVGPGFGDVGPAQNYAAMPALAKLVLLIMMIVGRLELYTMLVLFYLWRGLQR